MLGRRDFLRFSALGLGALAFSPRTLWGAEELPSSPSSYWCDTLGLGTDWQLERVAWGGFSLSNDPLVPRDVVISPVSGVSNLETAVERLLAKIPSGANWTSSVAPWGGCYVYVKQGARCSRFSLFQSEADKLSYYHQQQNGQLVYRAELLPYQAQEFGRGIAQYAVDQLPVLERVMSPADVSAVMSSVTDAVTEGTSAHAFEMNGLMIDSVVAHVDKVASDCMKACLTITSPGYSVVKALA